MSALSAGLGFGHEFGDFGLQLRLDLARMFMEESALCRLALAVDLRAVDPQSAQLQHAHLHAPEEQHLNEQPFDLCLRNLCRNVANGVVVGMDR